MSDKKYSIIAVLDTIEDKLIQQSLELIVFASSFAAGDLSTALVVVPGKSVMKLCESITEKYLIDTAAIEHDELYYPNPELLAELLYGTIGEYSPGLIIFTHTVRNSQCTAKLSVISKSSTVTAVESFIRDGETCIFQRSIFNGKLKINQRLNALLKIVTVLAGTYTLEEDTVSYKSNASVNAPAYCPAPASRSGAKHYGYKPISLSPEALGGVKLEDADVIISAGRGIGKEENLSLISETASIFENAAVGASRPICDQRWLPFNQQVGITGRTVSPKLYLACGISGSQQHIAGMKNSQCIVAINKDPDAAIFSVSDYIIVEDLIYFLPVLIRKYRDIYEKE